MNPQKKALAKKLLQHIRNGSILEQGKLPPERTLVKILQEKRPRIREAILILETLGILEVRERQGIFVIPPENPDFLSGLEQMLPRMDSMLSEIMEMRTIVEVPAARLGALRRTEEDLRNIQECFHALQELTLSPQPHDPSTGAHWNSLLHDAIMRATHNRILIRSHEGLASIMERSIVLLRETRKTQKPHIWSEYILKQHRNIVQAIEEQNPQKAEDGIVSVALGLGKSVVEGNNTVRFSPKFPKHLMQFFSNSESVKNAQQYFYSLDLNDKLYDDNNEIPNNLVKKYDLSFAEKDQTLTYLGSTYSAENEAIYDGISRPGQRVVTFAPILKYKVFPIPEILDLIIHFGLWGMGTQVEIEFAVNLTRPEGELKEFAILQMRPMVLSRESSQIDFDDRPAEDLLCQSRQVLGNGIHDKITDVIFVDKNKYDRSKSKEIALEVSKLNEKLNGENRSYLLIGVGRWGTLDHWLGIPVTWEQISGASVIVESDFKDFNVTPSQGSHFFHNITSFGIGYFTIPANNKDEFVDWEWLAKQKAVEEFEFTKHIRFDKPLMIKISGSENRGVIYKPKDKDY